MADDLSSLLRTDYKAVDKREGVHSVMGWLRGDSDKLPILMDADKPFGLVNDRALTSRRLDANAKLEGYALVTRALPQTASLGEVAARMAELRAAFLPIEDRKGQLAGYVTALDVARNNGASQRRARELALPVGTLRSDQTLGDAVHAFGQEYVDHLPVVSSEGKLEGVVHRRDVLVMSADSGDKGRMDARGERIHALRDLVGGFADGLDGVVRPDDSFERVAACLEAWGYALVVENNRLTGIVTPETLIRSLFH